MNENLFLAALDAVLRTTLTATIDTERVERTADDVVPDAWKVTDSTPANQHDGVFLKIVTLTTDVGADFTSVGKSDSCHLSQRRVRLLGSLSLHLKTHASALRT